MLFYFQDSKKAAQTSRKIRDVYCVNAVKARSLNSLNVDEFRDRQTRRAIFYKYRIYLYEREILKLPEVGKRL